MWQTPRWHLCVSYIMWVMTAPCSQACLLSLLEDCVCLDCGHKSKNQYISNTNDRRWAVPASLTSPRVHQPHPPLFHNTHTIPRHAKVSSRHLSVCLFPSWLHHNIVDWETTDCFVGWYYTQCDMLGCLMTFGSCLGGKYELIAFLAMPNDVRECES